MLCNRYGVEAMNCILFMMPLLDVWCMQKSMLNDKLVEAEKMTYDVVHDLLGVKSNISNVVVHLPAIILNSSDYVLLLCLNSLPALYGGMGH